MELKSGYKQTDAGVIPNDWRVEAFGSVARIERGKFTARPRNDPRLYGGDIPFIQTGDVANCNGQIRSYSQTLNKEGLKVSRLFPSGTLFFTIAANIGDVGFAEFDTACPDSLVAITANPQIAIRWLAYELQRRKGAFESLATHNAQMNVNLEKLRPYLLPVPPTKAEQEAIAEVLSDADALIESLEQLIEKKRQIKQGAMNELLTGIKRFPGFDGEWIARSLGEVAPLQRGFDLPYRMRNPGVVPIVTSSGVEDIHSEARVKAPGVVTGRYGTIGKVFFLKEDFWPLNTTLYVRNFLGNDPLFVSYLLRTIDFHMHSGKSGVPGVNRNDLHEIVVRLPKTKVEQEAIASALRDMDAELGALENELAKIAQLKQGIMQELLTGRIRLV